MKPTYGIYPEYEKCIQKLTWKWVKRSRFGFDELLSEANIGFMKAVDSFDDDKTCFHTHLHTIINGGLRHYIARQNHFAPFTKQMDSDIESNQSNPEQHCTFINMIENLSTEAKEIVEVVLNTPSEMIELVKEMSSNRHDKMHVYKSNVWAYFKAQGWKEALILFCFNEIKQTFN